ncbi:hypothetical protein TNCV_1892481, partial [Trichonephila clavipes]
LNVAPPWTRSFAPTQSKALTSLKLFKSRCSSSKANGSKMRVRSIGKKGILKRQYLALSWRRVFFRQVNELFVSLSPEKSVLQSTLFMSMNASTSARCCHQTVAAFKLTAKRENVDFLAVEIQFADKCLITSFQKDPSCATKCFPQFFHFVLSTERRLRIINIYEAYFEPLWSLFQIRFRQYPIS